MAVDTMKFLIHFLFLLGIAANGATWYVDDSASGANNGTSWVNAWTNFNFNASTLSAGDEVQIAAGYYTLGMNFNKAGTAAAPITFRLADDTNYLGHVYLTNGAMNIYANWITWNGALNTNYAIPASVHDLDTITNNIGIHLTTHNASGINIAGGDHIGLKLLWMHVYACGELDGSYPSDGEPNENGMSIGDSITNSEIAYFWFQDNIYGDTINSTHQHDNLLIHDSLFYGTGDDVIQIPGGFKFYRNKVRGRTYGYASGHSDVFQTWGSSVWVYNNVIEDFGEKMDADGAVDNTWNNRGTAGGYSYGPLSFMWSTNGSTPAEFVTNFTLGTLRTNETSPCWRGFKFKTGSSSVSVSALGRIYKTGNSTLHTLRLLSLTSDTDSGTVRSELTWNPAMGGVDGQILYTNLASPYTLSANTLYVIASGEEKHGTGYMPAGDVFYGQDTAIFTFPIAYPTNAVVSVPEYSSYGYVQTSYDVNHDFYFYGNLFMDQDTNRYCNPGLKFSHDAWWAVNGGMSKYCTNNVISNFVVANNLFLRPGGVPYGHTFYWIASDSSRGTNDLFTLTNTLFANNIILDSYNLTDGMLQGSVASWPTKTTNDTPVGSDRGPITTDYSVRNNLVSLPNFHVSAHGSNYANILAADADLDMVSGSGTNLPAFRFFESRRTYPKFNFRVSKSDTAALGTGTNLLSWTNLMPGLLSDLDGNARPSVGAWDIGPYQYGSESLILWFDFDDTNWVSTGRLTDMSGRENHAYQFGYGNGTNWPLLSNGNNGSYAGNFNRWTNTVLSEGQEGRYAGITNLADFATNNTATFAVWAYFNPTTNSGGWSKENNQSFIDAGFGYAGGFKWGKNGTKAVTIYYWTNSINTDGSSEEIMRWPDTTDANGGSTNWHHYAFTYNSTNVSAYYDGVFLSNSLMPFLDATNLMMKGWIAIGCKTHYSVPNPQETPQFGDDAYPNHGWLNGVIDDLRIYNRALSAQEIASLYAGAGASANGSGGGEGQGDIPGAPSRFVRTINVRSLTRP